MTDIRFLSPITVLSNIGGISIDITQKSGETYENIITQNPIEDGSPTTDHITNLPVKVQIQGGFSDIRISNLVGTTLATQNAIKGLAKTNFDKLLELYAERETFTVMDGLHAFKDMQFKTLQQTKDREGFSVFFEAELWRIIKINIDNTQARSVQNSIDATDRLLVAPQLLLQVGAISEPDSLEQLGILA